MKMVLPLLAALAVTGCVGSPAEYQSSLSQADSKWTSPGCQQARLKAAEYEAREKKNPGWAAGALFGPYGLGIVAAVKENEQKQRKRFSREIHMQCSSLPLPRELEPESPL